MSNEQITEARTCPRCGSATAYWPEAIVPGDPVAPRRTRRAVAHAQPAWVCISCGYLQAEERRVARRAQRQDA